MKSAITAIGTANPPYKQSQQTAVEIVTQALKLKPVDRRILRSIYKSSGIDHRYSVLSDFCRQPGEYEFFPNDTNLPFPSTSERMRMYKENALDLAIKAIQNCIDYKNNFKLQDITHLITVSCTGMYAPGLDIEIVQQLKLNFNTKRTCVNFMGCYGAFNAIKLADAICKSERDAKVLIVSVELCTIHFQKNDAIDSMISNAVFADGAAAVLIESHSHQQKCFNLDTFHCDLLPQHSQEMTWQIADSGFDIVLSSYVPQVIQSGISNFIQRLKSEHDAALDKIDFYAIHPGGYKIIKACEEALSISEQDNKYSYDVLRQFGNMSSATVLFVLKAIWNEVTDADAGKKIMSCAFGPGLTLEAMMLSVG